MFQILKNYFIFSFKIKNMKKIILSFYILISTISVYAQQETEIGRYRLRSQKGLQDTVYMKIGKAKTILKKGWVIIETRGGSTIQRTLTDDSVVISKKDIPIKVTSDWRIGEVKHTDDAPDKLHLNPYNFIDPKDSTLNNKSYIKIPNNGFVTLKKSFVKWNAITIPLAIRPALNDKIGSRITTDLKIGASFSYNVNWEKFRNRRIKAKKSIWGLSGGIGFGFSKVSLNSSSTSLLKEPYINEEDGLAFFIAPGIGFNLKGFQVNFSYGWDVSVTNNVEDWNYANEGYLGIGLGIGLNVFGKE